ncbi:hypothetical protein M0811_01811 [Anaeramoeba ignava]|uniref:Uncharacterized protein n=1 Tax=Anaeramoeba ignava TaxID=1746090 RepID=A0A9Q0LFB8_ANAIG|nr:hypothetical protein M0811_01811 [Anaeramoeba ignava]|eukprot:Anaeramoba_ignava/a4330_121.p1 GENE.a4330_121~~a4330_121.p1  ORF type:complete len:436 (+),score=142.98 a4330_121:23-1330(+)
METSDPFSYSEKKAQISSLFLHLMGIKPSDDTNPQYVQFVATLHYLIFLGEIKAPCKVQMGSIWVDSFLCINPDFFELKFSDNSLVAPQKYDYDPEYTLKRTNYKQLALVTGEEVNLSFESDLKASLVLELFNVYSSAESISKNITSARYLRPQYALQMGDMIPLTILAHWCHKNSIFTKNIQVLKKEERPLVVHVQLDKAGLIITQPPFEPDPPIPYTASYEILFSTKRPRFKLIVEEEEYEFILQNDPARDFLFHLLTFKFNIQNSKAFHQFFSEEKGNFVLSLDSLFTRPPVLPKTSIAKIHYYMKKIIAAKKYRVPVLVTSQRIYGNLLLLPTEIQLVFGSEKEIVAHYKNTLIFQNDIDPTVLLLETYANSETQKFIIQPKRAQDTDVLMNAFMYFKTLSNDPEFIFEKEMIKIFASVLGKINRIESLIL